MNITPMNKGFRVEASFEELDKSLLMGWTQKRGCDWIRVEDNLVNRLVLGLPIDFIYEKNAPELICYDLLQDFQKKDVLKMLGLKHSLNANPMGLGKTVEAVKYCQSRDSKSILIVTPKIIRYQWMHQIEDWWGRTDVTICEGCFSVQPGSIYVINYDKLRDPKTLVKFKNFQWDILILDEAHRIKNRKSQQAIACKDIPAAHRIALTGTPILRYVDDLWSILNFLDERYSGTSYWTFVNYFCRVQKTPWGDRITGLTTDPKKIAILNKVLELICIRNNISVTMGKVYETVRLPMSKPQAELYQKEKQLLLDELPENCTIANGAVLTLRLRQTLSWPGMFLDDNVVGMDGPKFEYILSICKDHPEDKFLVFSTFETSIEALCRYLTNNRIGAVTITGKKKARENEKAKKQFLKVPGIQVLGGTIGAMGQGYDELQGVCHIVIFLDRDWSPMIMDQAEDRLNRWGQKYLVQVINLECEKSFDQHVGKINKNKADDIREALADD